MFCAFLFSQIDPINLLRALQPALSVEPSRLLPTLRVVQLIEEVARTFILVQPHTVSEGVSSFFASSLCDVYAHLCFEESWRAKAAGCLVLIRLLRTLPPEWAQRNLVKIAEAAFFVSKDATAPYAPVAQLVASECLITLFTVAFCGYAGPVRLPFLQLAFGIRTSPLWRDCGSDAEGKAPQETEESSGEPKEEEDDVEMTDARAQETKRRKGESTGETACETDLLAGCDVPVEEKEGEDDSEYLQYQDDMKRFASPPSTFLRSLRLAAEGVVFRVLSSSSVTSEADIEAAERLGRTLVPPPIPESDPVSYRSRRSRPPNTPWWMKRSEWLTWQKLNSGAGGCTTVSDPSCDSTDGTQNVFFTERQGSGAALSLPVPGQGEGSGASRIPLNGQSIPDHCSSSPSHVCSVCTSELSWKPAEELRPAVCRILEKLLIPNLYQVRTECRRLGQRLFLLLPRLLGTDAAALLGGADENCRTPGSGSGSGKSAGDPSQNSGRNEAPRSSQQEQTTGAPAGDSGQQTAGPLRRSESQGDRVSPSTSGEKKDICTLPLPVSALTRVLKWVTLRPVALLTLQWQVAFLDCICFLAALRPAPSALRPFLEQDIGMAFDQAEAKAGRGESADGQMEEVKRERTSLATSVGSRDSSIRRERGGSLTGDAGSKEAASVVCWLIEDALAVLAKGLETEAACFPSPVLLSVADEQGRGHGGQAGALPSGGPESKQQQTDGGGPAEGNSTKEGCEDGNRGGGDSDLTQTEGALQEMRDEEEASRSQPEKQDRRDGSSGSAASAGGIPENEEELKAASRILQAVLHAGGTTESGRRGGYDGQGSPGNTSGGIVIDEAYTSVSRRPESPGLFWRVTLLLTSLHLHVLSKYGYRRWHCMCRTIPSFTVLRMTWVRLPHRGFTSSSGRMP